MGRRLHPALLLQLQKARELKRALKAARQNERELLRRHLPRLIRDHGAPEPSAPMPALRLRTARDITCLLLAVVEPVEKPRRLTRSAALEQRPAGHYRALEVVNTSVTLAAGVNWLDERPSWRKPSKKPARRVADIGPSRLRRMVKLREGTTPDDPAGGDDQDQWMGYRR